VTARVRRRFGLLLLAAVLSSGALSAAIRAKPGVGAGLTVAGSSLLLAGSTLLAARILLVVDRTRDAPTPRPPSTNRSGRSG